MKTYKFIALAFCLILPYTLDAKNIPMKSGYRQLKLVEFSKNRNGNAAAFIYSESSASNKRFMKKLNKTQELMIETISQSLKISRVTMANSIWKKFVKSLNNNSLTFDINNILFWMINESYLKKKPLLTYRASLYKSLKDKVEILEAEKDVFKKTEKDCEANSHCDYDTKDEIKRTNDLWRKRTKIFTKELKRAEKKFKETFDINDGHSRLIQQVGTLFFESAEAIVSEQD